MTSPNPPHALRATTPGAPRYFALIPAAGVGARMAADGPKQYLAVAGKPMLRHALDAFLASPRIAHTFVVVSADDAQIDGVVAPPAAPPAVPAPHAPLSGMQSSAAALPFASPSTASAPDAASSGVTVLRCGGATRMASVQNALRALRDQLNDDDWVLVHDAARPGLTPALVAALIDGVGAAPAGGLLALPVVDTVKRVGQGGAALATVPRDGLWLAQTPQMFPYQLLVRALAAATDASAITDDASAVEALGLSPVLVAGHPRNFKVTLPADIRIAEMYLADPQ